MEENGRSEAKNRTKQLSGLSDFGLKTIGILLLSLSVSSTTWLPLVLGHEGRSSLLGMGIMVVCEALSWASAPLYAWLLVQGFRYTHNLWIYGFRLLILALVSEVPYDLASSGKSIDWESQNPVFALVLILIVLAILDWARDLRAAVRWPLSVLVVCSGLAWMLLLHIGVRQQLINFGAVLLVFSLIFYSLHERENTMMLSAGLVGAMALVTPAIGVVILHFRKDRQGYVHGWTKWVFYALYPLMLLAFAFMR